jgi:hypothetical protein
LNICGQRKNEPQIARAHDDIQLVSLFIKRLIRRTTVSTIATAMNCSQTTSFSTPVAAVQKV